MLVGETAKRKRVLEPENVVYEVKRFIGMKYDEVKKEAERMPYKTKKGKDGGVIIVVDDKEYKPEQIAANETDWIELELEAMTVAKSMDIDEAEAILRAQYGSQQVSNASSKELKRDLLILARNNPSLFLDLANDDNVMLRNIGIKATETGILSLSQDQRTFTYASNGRKLLTVPFNEHPYSALAAYFKTDEGMEVLRAVEKQL